MQSLFLSRIERHDYLYLFHRFPLPDEPKEWSDDESEWNEEDGDSIEDLIVEEEDTSAHLQNGLDEEIDSSHPPVSDEGDDLFDETVTNGTLLSNLPIPLVVSPTSTRDSDPLFKFLHDVHALLGRTRKIIRFIRRSSLVEAYVREQITNPVERRQLVCDFHVRWNSTSLMLKRFLMHKNAITGIISTPERIAGLSKEQKTELKGFVISHSDWELLETISVALEPFVLATKILSGRLYPTIGTGFFVYRTLGSFLEVAESDSSPMISIKRSLRYHFNVYFHTNVDASQRQYMLVRKTREDTCDSISMKSQCCRVQ